MSTLFGNRIKGFLRHHLIARGERSIASMGAAAVVIILGAMAANAWWVLATVRDADSGTRLTQLRTVGSVLSSSAEELLNNGDLSAARRLVMEASRNYHLYQCRIVLAPDRILADGNPARINVRTVPATWDAGPLDASSQPGTLSLSYPIRIRDHGVAMLELSAMASSPWWALWQADVGFALIGASALGVFLLVYRINCARLQAIEAIHEGLRCYAAGEPMAAALAVDGRFGAIAQSWNKLLTEITELRRQVSLHNLKRTTNDRRGSGGLEAACDTMSQGLVLVDERLHIRFANGAASVFLNTPREKLIGKPLVDLIDDQKVRTAVGSVANKKSRRPVTVELERKGEGHGVLRFSIRPTRKGDAEAATVVIEDITQQRTAERARNSFITQVTHELRTPLTNIRLYAETAIDDTHADAATRSKCLNIINQESRRLERVVSEMLSVAEIESGSFSIRKDDVHVDALFDELRSDYQAQAQDKNIQLDVVLPPKLPIIHADRDKVTLAIHNLVGNALKYTPKGGKVILSANVVDRKLQIDVADTGIGIQAEELESIFDRFTRSKDPRVAKIVGTGLGLTLAREVMRLHGGDVTVQSELNRGSTFTATLPVTAEAA